MNIEKVHTLIAVIRVLNETPLCGDILELATAALKAELTGDQPTEEVKVDAQADKPKQTRAKKAAKVQPVEQEAAPSKSLFEATDEAPEAETQDAPTVAELQAICLTMVRADRTKKDPIKALIKSFGGKTIEEVDASKYVELKAALGDL